MKFLRKIIKNIKKNKKLYRRLILFVFFGAITGIYFHNVTRDVYSGDIGDLVTAAWVFGVAHPPGYPLFTFLGYLFSHYLPFIDLPPVSKVAFISVISSVVGLIFFYKFAVRVTKSLYLSLLSTSILGFSYLYWLQAEIPEVFAFNNLFVILILYYALLFYQEKQAKHLYLLVFLCGLSLTHHHTILFLFPAILLLVTKHFKFVFLNPKRILIILGLFILGLLPYIYVPIAASQNPVINWNNASNLENFIDLVSRRIYGDFAPSPFGVPLGIKFIIVADYFKTIIFNFSYQIIFIFLLGVIYLFKKSKWLLFSLLFAFVFTGPLFAFYCAVYAVTEGHIGIIERFYVLSSVVFVFFVVYGFLFLKNIVFRIFTKKIYAYAILGYFLIIPYFQLIYNFPKTNLSKTEIGANIVRDMLSSLPQNSLLITSGDTQTFNTRYMHHVIGYRTDLILAKSKAVQEDNYVEIEKKKYKKKHPEMDEKRLTFYTYEEIRKERRIFSVVDFNVDNTSILIPKGLVYELIYKKDVPTKEEYEKEIKLILKTFHIPKRDLLEPYNDNLIAMEIPAIYSEAYIQIATFFSIYYKDFEKAEYFYRKAVEIDDRFHHAYAGLATNQYNRSKDCKNSIANMNMAIELYPVRNDYYIYLYTLYENCGLPKNKLSGLKKKYQAQFNSEIEKDREKRKL